ncbi:DUF6359 domain-containing protein [Paenibacillus phocaensis]|uniref:DUF6359 domain-containing protein n=1 Tax=Paenibacillus phocaensis TaxID=1776378 RepID=UPI000839D377
MSKGNANAWRNKWLGLLLAGALVVTGLPGWAPQAAAQPADSQVAAEASDHAVEDAGNSPLMSDGPVQGIDVPAYAPEAEAPQMGEAAEPAAGPASNGSSLQAASASLSVAEAVSRGNNGETVEVTGTIVGHATGLLTADFEAPFGNDFNFLIADTAGERDKAKLIDVQVPAGLRAAFGLQSNPDLIGQSVVVAGSLAAYNNFTGLKSVTAISLSQNQPEEPGEDPGEEPGEDPGGDPGQGPDPGEVPQLPDGTGKKVLFDNAHGQTAGAADWVIDGAFSDFAAGLRAAGFTVESLDRPLPYTFGETAITYGALQPYDVFVIPEANIPFKAAEQEALVQYVENGGAVFFISDHYNADRNKNRWDASEVFNGYRRGAYENPAKGMSAEEASSPAMQEVSSSDWLADNFGVRFRYNALGDVNATDIVHPSQSFGITAGVEAVAMHAGSTVAILDPQKAKGLVYVPTGVPAWGNAVDEGVYDGGGRAEGPYAAIAKRGLGKAAFIGDSSPVEDATPQYVREENGQKKTTYDGFQEVDDGLFLVQTVKWLAHDENYTSFSEVPGLALDAPTLLGADEEPAATTEPQPEPWSQPAPGYKWYDPATFKPGSYGSLQAPDKEPVFAFVHQAQLPSQQEFQIRVTADDMTPGQTVSDLRVGIYLAGGEQIARFLNTDGNWSDYNYSPAFSLTGDTQGHASKELTVQLKPGITATSANLRLKRGSANEITKPVEIANVDAEPLPGDHPPVPQPSTIAEVRGAAEGAVVTTQGVITSEPGIFGGQGFYLQDETAGIYVFQTAEGYHVGDLIRISATRTLYNGEVELENPVLIEKLGTAPLPQPQVQDAVSDTNQGQFITLTQVEVRDVVAATPAGSFEFYAVRDDGSLTRVRFDGRTGVTMDSFAALYPAGTRVDISGIASVFRGTFQLKPLALAHVVPSKAEADLTAPVTSSDVAGVEGADVYNQTEVTVSFYAKDEGGSGLERTEYRVNGGEWVRYAEPLVLAADGKYSVEYRSVDQAGNQETSQILYINVDRQAPEVTFAGDNQVLQVASSVPFAIAVNDAVSGAKSTAYRLDGRAIPGVAEIVPFSLAVGTHKLTVQATDAAGHTALVDFTFQVTIDIAHLDELVDLGKAHGYFKTKGTATSLQAHVASLQKAKTKLEREIKLKALKLTLHVQSGLTIKESFAKLMMEDLEYIGGKAA